MAVTDARCYGSAINISKKQLWQLFSLDKYVTTQCVFVKSYCLGRCTGPVSQSLMRACSLNICLDSDPSAAELMYDMSTRQSHHHRAPVYTRAIMDFNFSAAPAGSDACVVQLMLENTGAVPCEW